jgi:hypothetical protein
MLREVGWQLVADVSTKHIQTIFMDKAVKKRRSSWTAWTLKMGPKTVPKYR